MPHLKLNEKDKDIIHDIILSYTKILHYTEGSTESKLLKDTKTVDAILFNLTMIGQLYGKLSPIFQEKYESFLTLELMRKLSNNLMIDPEDAWDMFYNEDLGIIQYYNMFIRIYRIEINNEDIPYRAEHEVEEKTEVDTNYKYPIYTSKSIRPVKYRTNRWS